MATLNGLKITVDEQTGSIIGLDYPGPGKILQAKPEASGIIDVAYPIPEFQPLRLASRFSKGARIAKSGDAIDISWEDLGASRPYFKPVGGRVSAKVWMKALPDGRSISMRCQVFNKSQSPVGQILFPDFHGLLPFAGTEGTTLRTAGFTRRPFVDVRATSYPEFYAVDRRSDTKDTFEFSGGYNIGDGDNMILRWLDYGGLNGGFNLFPKVWSGAPNSKIRIYRLEKDPNLRLFYQHDFEIKPGESWESPEYILTPHQHGWAKGIGSYRDFAKTQIKRRYPMPQHVREGLGYRTIFMCKGYPADGERDIAFRFADLPKVAKESKEHGLDELVVWFWKEGFQLPIPPPYPHLGTPEELSQAIKECNAIGVNVSLFVSNFSIAEPTASRYGLKVSPQDYTYHPELIPRINTPYARTRRIVKANTNDPRWRNDVLSSTKNIFEKYSRSICWDEGSVGTSSVFPEFLPWAKENDPRATFSGEIAGLFAERSADFFDYTWNWESGSFHANMLAPYRDNRGFMASFEAPRLNTGINRNAQHIKRYFMDNNYLNVMPSAPDDANGTAWLKDCPDVSRVLKQVAGLRRQFLEYFTDGTSISECLLKEPSPGAHVDAYVLTDRVLFIIMNTQDQAKPVNFRVDLGPWLKSSTDKYEVRSYDQYGKSLDASMIAGPDWKGETCVLKSLDFAIFEFIGQ